MGTVVLDTSVIIGFLDKSDAHNERATAAIVRLHDTGGQAIMPASVLSETLVSAAKYGARDLDRVRGLLRHMFGAARPIDEDIAVRAAELRARHRALRLPDALVIATGIEENAEAILTGDKRWADIDPRVTILGEANG